MFKKLRDFDAKYSSIFFCISLLIIIIFLAYFSVSHNNKEKICLVPNKLVNNYTNYSYDVIYEKDNKITKLSIKRYDSKYLIEKNEDDVKSTYYIYYTDILEKASNGEYIKYRKDNIVDGLNNKFLILDYINDISLESNISSDKELTCYNNRKLGISMCINLDDSITLKSDDYTISYEIKDVGTIEEFSVKTNLNVSFDDIYENTNNTLEQ